MKKIFVITPLFLMTFTGCEMVNKMNQATYAINENACTVEQSTAAIERNLDTLQKMK